MASDRREATRALHRVSSHFKIDLEEEEEESGGFPQGQILKIRRVDQCLAPFS